MSSMELISRLAQPAAGKIVLLVIDGVGDVRTEGQPETALERAHLPHLDRLTRRSALGRLVPVVPGVTPGSGPGHLGLFGYDPTLPETDIGRGVLEALGLGLELDPRDVAARGNFATAGPDGNLTDRRAGRIPTAECRRLVGVLQEAVAAHEGAAVRLTAGEGHRFVLVLSGDGLSPAVADTDPQKLGAPPLEARSTAPEGEATAGEVAAIVRRMNEALAAEAQANRVLLRGFSRLPALPGFGELYGLRAGAFAGYPLYRGVAQCCGMEVVDCGKQIEDIVAAVRENWRRFDFFFLHVKQTDAAGEDGDLAKKAEVLERVDAALPALLEAGPEVIAITGDHSTPAPMKAHSWHPVPLLLHSPRCFIDGSEAFTETAATGGHLGTLRSCELMGLLLANAGRLAKFGA